MAERTTQDEERIFETLARAQAETVYEIAAMRVAVADTNETLIEPSLTDSEVNLHKLGDEITAGMVSLASFAYLLGRLDQINDMEGNNQRRAVRVKDLPQVIFQALGVEGVDWDSDVVLATLKRYRGAFVALQD